MQLPSIIDKDDYGRLQEYQYTMLDLLQLDERNISGGKLDQTEHALASLSIGKIQKMPDELPRAVLERWRKQSEETGVLGEVMADDFVKYISNPGVEHVVTIEMNRKM